MMAADPESYGLLTYKVATSPLIYNLVDAIRLGLFDDHEWHIIRDNDRDVSLCGCELEDGINVPALEVPDDITCPACLAIERLENEDADS